MTKIVIQKIVIQKLIIKHKLKKKISVHVFKQHVFKCNIHGKFRSPSGNLIKRHDHNTERFENGKNSKTEMDLITEYLQNWYIWIFLNEPVSIHDTKNLSNCSFLSRYSTSTRC